MGPHERNGLAWSEEMMIIHITKKQKNKKTKKQKNKKQKKRSMGPHEINGLTKREQMSTACIVFLVPISLLFRPINSYVYYTLYSMIANKYSRKKWKLKKYGAPWKKWSCQEGGNDDHQYHFNAVFWMVASEFDDFGFLILAFFCRYQCWEILEKGEEETHVSVRGKNTEEVSKSHCWWWGESSCCANLTDTPELADFPVVFLSYL